MSVVISVLFRFDPQEPPQWFRSHYVAGLLTFRQTLISINHITTRQITTQLYQVIKGKLQN